MNKFTCIGIAGQKRVGKTTLAKYLASKLLQKLPVPAHGGGVYELGPWGQGSFAGEVKRIFCETFNKDLVFVEEWKVKNEIPPGMAMTVRQALVAIGDGFRKIQPDIWIERAFRPEAYPHNRVFDDCRFCNEVKRIRQEGGMNVLLYRDNYLNWEDDNSEKEIRPYVMWCMQTGKEGKIADWTEFKNQNLNVWGSEREGFEPFWNSLPEDIQVPEMSPGKTFFERLSHFDIFVRW